MSQICTRCKTKQASGEFLNASGKTLKTCNQCRGGRPSAEQYYAEPIADNETENSDSDSDSESEDGYETDSESESEDEFEAHCEPCNKTFYDEASATKHANTKSHIQNWTRVNA
jgi:protein-arginine kinase activator protein McsA